jgi:hypothetical protein
VFFLSTYSKALLRASLFCLWKNGMGFLSLMLTYQLGLLGNVQILANGASSLVTMSSLWFVLGVRENLSMKNIIINKFISQERCVDRCRLVTLISSV